MIRIRVALLALATIFVASLQAQATLTDYLFNVGTGTRADTSGSTVIWRSVPGSGGIANQAVSVPLGFSVEYDYQNYTQISISSNGVLGLGPTTVTTSPTNSLGTIATPTIAPWWDGLRVAGGGGCYSARVSWKLTGAAPLRVFVVDYDNVELVRITGAPTRGQIQVRIYEGSNRIEFWYGRMTSCDDCFGSTTCANTSASVGLANGSGNFLSVTPVGATATTSTTTANNNVNINGPNPVTSGTMYTFDPGYRRAVLTSNFAPVDAGNPLFTLMNACVGEYATSVPVTITNSGSLPMTVRSIDIYRLDSTFHQGTPSLHLSRNQFGRTVRSTDYAVSQTPGTAPITTNPPLATPIVIPAGGADTLYVTFVGQTPGRRLARMFVRTDAMGITGIDSNFFGPGVPQTMTAGLIAVDLLGEAIGPWLRATTDGLKIRPVVFPDTRAGDTSYAELVIANAGACDLRIDRRRLRIFSGDVNEFAFVRRFSHTSYDVMTGDDVLAAGMSDTMLIRFTPVRSGARLATMFMQTNDSTLGIPGLTERGSYYVDLFGFGRAGLDSRPLVLRPVLIGSFVNGVAVLENSSIASVDVASIRFMGGDSAEFSQDPANPWPTSQIRVLGGGTLTLSVRLTPTGTSGIRRTTLVVITTTGDTARIQITGEAGMQQLTVSPSSLFENTTIPVGASVRQTIVISNVGTLPVSIQPPVLSGLDASNYRLGPLPRLYLEPGQSEFLEVTFAPTAAGSSSAEIRFSSNAGPDQIVTLGGEALRARRDLDPSTLVTPGIRSNEPVMIVPERSVDLR